MDLDEEKVIKDILQWLHQHPEMLEHAVTVDIVKPIPLALIRAIEKARIRYRAGWNN
jgi:hypothetical protein